MAISRARRRADRPLQLVPISSVQGTPLTVSPALAPLLASEIVTPAASLRQPSEAALSVPPALPANVCPGGHGRRGRAAAGTAVLSLAAGGPPGRP